MEITEAKLARRNLEIEMIEAISKFEEKTGLRISDELRLTRYNGSNNSGGKVTNISLRCQI